MALVPIFSASQSVAIASALNPTDPVIDSEGVYGVVAGPVPTTAPTLHGVTSGQTFTTSDPVALQGSCPNGTIVKIFKNEVFAGGTLCKNGSFKLSIDLFVGSNALVARAYNTNDVASPDSATTPVYLSLAGIGLQGTSQLNSSGSPANQFFVTSDISHRGAGVGATMSWPLIISGGQQPYAVSVSWGDGKTDLISQRSPGRFDVSHAYQQPGGYQGSYTIVIKASDFIGSSSYLQLVSIVSGGKKPISVVSSVSRGYRNSVFVRSAWQLLVAAGLVVLAFWLGEKRELHVTRRQIVKPA